MEEGPGGTASSKDRRYPQVLVVASAFAPPLPPAPLLDCKPLPQPAHHKVTNHLTIKAWLFVLAGPTALHPKPEQLIAGL